MLNGDFIMTGKKLRYPKVRCGRCGNCCRLPEIPITHRDLERLVESTGKPASRIVRFCPDSEMEYDAESGLWIDFKSGKHAMVLRKKSGRCAFQAAKCACAVYESRPQTCRTFPYSVEFGDITGKTAAKISLNRVLECNAAKCSAIDLDKLLADVRKESREDIEYHGLIRAWNESGGSGGTAGFLRFIGF